MSQNPVPAALLRAVVDSNRLGGAPRLPEGRRGEATAWLARVLTRNRDWLNHMTALRETMGLPPTPQLPVRDGQTAKLQWMVDALHLQFPCRPALPEDTAFAILEQGLVAADDE